jgi:putative ABC transport system ATP-binding protein
MIIDLKGVSKKYITGETEFFVLKDIDLKIKEGEFISIVGASGSGKSTLLHLIGALDRPTTGTVKIMNKNIAKLNDDSLAELRNTAIGFVFQTFNLIPRLTALENVTMPTYFGTNVNKEKAMELIKMVGLEKRAHHMPNQLSGGERQRVAIARALINDPKVILADEPTGNLDTKTGGKIIDVFKTLNKQGKTVIIITHDTNIAKSANRKIKIRDGMIV